MGKMTVLVAGGHNSIATALLRTTVGVQKSDRGEYGGTGLLHRLHYNAYVYRVLRMIFTLFTVYPVECKLRTATNAKFEILIQVLPKIQDVWEVT
jgi:hypothetical protein